MKRYSRIKGLALALVMLISSLAGLVAASAELEHVTLDWYYIADSYPDQEQVWEKLNEYFLEKINATVNFHPIPGSEYGTKMSTYVNAGQTLDILSVSSQLPYVDYSRKEAFIPLEDLLAEYMPATYAMIPQDFWNAMYVDGHIYAVPSYKDSCNIPGIIYNETLLNDIGVDMSAVEWVSMYDLIPVYYEMQAKRNEKYPEDSAIPMVREFADPYFYNQYETINSIAVVNIPGIEAFAGKGAGETVFNLYATDEYRKYCNTIKQLVDDNIMPFDAWNFDTNRTYTSEGKMPILSYGSGYIYVQKDYSSKNFDAALLRNKNTVATTNYLHEAANAISITSKNPERALMLLELVNTDPYVATTIRFGIEGEHYTVQEDGRIDFTGLRNEDPSARGYYQWYGAYLGSFMHSRVPNTYPANFAELMIEANEQAIADTNMGFVFDTTPVQNEIAACSSVVGEYTVNFKFGFVENVDEIVDEFVAKLEASGAQKIVDEAQKQLNAWRAEKGLSIAE